MKLLKAGGPVLSQLGVTIIRVFRHVAKHVSLLKRRKQRLTCRKGDNFNMLSRRQLKTKKNSCR